MATIQERVQTSLTGLRGQIARRPSGRTFIPRLSPLEFHPQRRFLRVFSFFLRMVVHIYIWDIFLSRFAITRWYARRTGLRRWTTIARRFRGMAIELGGMQIKLGQFLSSRADILPEQVTSELAGLQDEVPPAPTDYILDTITSELGLPPEKLFTFFDPTAVAAASLGQVHYATLPDGREVAVKVRRPRIDEIIEVDLNAVSLVVRLIKNYPPIRRRANLQGLLDEFGKVLREELDYEHEAINSEIFRANFADTSGVYVPLPIKEYSTKCVLVMERISGVKITDFATLDALGISRHELAERLNHAYLKQFFLDGFFHADPHPGNLFVRADGPSSALVTTNGSSLAAHNGTAHNNGTSNGTHAPESNQPISTPFTLIFIDFGMVGLLRDQTKDSLRDAVVGLATNDAERMVAAFDRLGAILPTADRRQVVQGFETIMRFAYDRSMRELSNLDVQAIMDETHDMVFDMPFQMPQDLIYLGRALSMVGGMATMIDPDINLFDSMRPFTRQLIAQEQRDTDWVGRINQELRELGQILIKLPRQMDAYYKLANRGELQARAGSIKLERGLRRVERSNNRLTGGIVATGLFLGGVQLRTKGMTKEADRAWTAAAAAVLWALWPQSDGSR